MFERKTNEVWTVFGGLCHDWLVITKIPGGEVNLKLYLVEVFISVNRKFLAPFRELKIRKKDIIYITLHILSVQSGSRVWFRERVHLKACKFNLTRVFNFILLIIIDHQPPGGTANV
jgi:hypothetical protein